MWCNNRLLAKEVISCKDAPSCATNVTFLLSHSTPTITHDPKHQTRTKSHLYASHVHQWSFSRPFPPPAARTTNISVSAALGSSAHEQSDSTPRLISHTCARRASGQAASHGRDTRGHFCGRRAWVQEGRALALLLTCSRFFRSRISR